MSESKFRSDPSSFIPHILNPNPTALDALITKPAIERALLNRLGKKASIYGPEIGLDGNPLLGGQVNINGHKTPPDENGNGNGSGDAAGAKWKVDVESVRELYESWIIPLTKEVEVRCLLHFLQLCLSFAIVLRLRSLTGGLQG